MFLQSRFVSNAHVLRTFNELHFHLTDQVLQRGCFSRLPVTEDYLRGRGEAYTRDHI